MPSKNRGFTLIELMIVTVIIGILVALAVPKFSNTKEKAYIAAMKSDLRNLFTIEEAYLRQRDLHLRPGRSELHRVDRCDGNDRHHCGSAGWVQRHIVSYGYSRDVCDLRYHGPSGSGHQRGCAEVHLTPVAIRLPCRA